LHFSRIPSISVSTFFRVENSISPRPVPMLTMNCPISPSTPPIPWRHGPWGLGRAKAGRLACLAIAAGAFCLTTSSAALGQDAAKPAAPNHVRSVLGFEDLKNNENCTVEVTASAIRLKGEKSTVEIATSSINDVLTGDDSARMVGGFLGTLTMFAPYSSGRFLSLFRKKLDTLTIEYRDAQGGIHGGILSMKSGLAATLKKQLVDAGAHTSIPIEDPAKPATAPSSGSASSKNSEKKS